MPKFDFNKVAKQLWHGCSSVNLLHIFRTSFPEKNSGGLFLQLLFFMNLALNLADSKRS